jgi:hypothetical protein
MEYKKPLNRPKKPLPKEFIDEIEYSGASAAFIKRLRTEREKDIVLNEEYSKAVRAKLQRHLQNLKDYDEREAWCPERPKVKIYYGGKLFEENAASTEATDAFYYKHVMVFCSILLGSIFFGSILISILN